MNYKVIWLYFFIINQSLLYGQSYQITYPDYNPGFFSVFFTVLGALNFYETSSECTGLSVDFENKGFYYDAGTGLNWWQYYFEPIDLGLESGSRKTFPRDTLSGFWFSSLYEMSRERGNELIKKYVIVKPHVQKKIDQFVNDYFQDYIIIGLHYRGTDKITEAPAVSYDTVINLMRAEVAKNPNIKIFVATDEEKFLTTMRENFPEKILALESSRSSDEKPIHHSTLINPYLKGEEAVMDCILLSKCAKLYRTSSNLSAASTRFNPHIDVVLLNKNIYE